MTMNTLLNDSKLVQQLAATPDHGSPKHWVLRDDNHQHYHGRVDLGDGFVVIELSWKADRRDSAKLVGCYRLDLRGLMDVGAVRPEAKGRRRGQVRVRFRRDDDGVIYLQVRRDQPRIRVGVMPRTTV